jgi:hypothetical protein
MSPVERKEIKALDPDADPNLAKTEELSSGQVPDEDSGDAVQVPLSLAERMDVKRKQVESRTTIIMDIPGWEDVLAVEFQVLSWEAMKNLAKRHRRLQNDALQELYTAADHLIAATVAFYENRPDGSRERIEDGSWVGLARNVKPLKADATDRQGLLLLMRDSPTIFLWSDWQEWLKTRKEDVDDEVMEDFTLTR